MFDIRKAGLTVMALGLFTTPAMAQLGINTDTGVDVKVETPTVNAETTTGATGSVTTEAPSFVSYDTNADGQISEVEFASSITSDMSLETFSELDTDSSGALDEGEFEALAQLEAETSTSK